MLRYLKKRKKIDIVFACVLCQIQHNTVSANALHHAPDNTVPVAKPTKGTADQLTGPITGSRGRSRPISWESSAARGSLGQSRTISSEIPIESFERSRPQNPERSRGPIDRTRNRRSWTQQMNLTHLKNDNMK